MAAQVVVDGEDVLSIYKKVFIVKIPLQSIVDFEFCECFDLFKKGTNCSILLVLPSVLSLTAALCGPKSEVSQMH